MRLTKAQRQAVFDRFGGRCAYCGGTLPAKWHADHFEAVERKLAFREGRVVTTSDVHRPENERIENMMPSCPPCNISKGVLSLEAWRSWLAGHVASLNRHHTPYRLVKAYGLVKETGKPVEFYFERLARGEQPAPKKVQRTPYGSFMLAIARVAKPSKNEYVAHHVRRLIDALRKDGQTDLASALQATLASDTDRPAARVIAAGGQVPEAGSKCDC